jgi:hypothetical protein
MKHVFEHIKQTSAAFQGRPLFVYLRDERISPTERLKFVPCMAHFVMTFADLYHFFLTEETPKDRYHELVNTHLAEEGTHWKWFLADLTNMNLDPELRFTDALRLLWSDATKQTRRLAYEICKLSANMSSLQKLVLVQAIEATGRVGLEAAVPVGNLVARDMKRNLVYFGGHHLDTERQHTLEEDDVHSGLEMLELDQATKDDLCRIVDKVFAHFAGFVDEAHRVAQSGRSVVESVAEARLAG